jgi:hypothetical protein
MEEIIQPGRPALTNLIEGGFIMFKISRVLSSAFLALTILLAAAGSGCAGRVRIYDEYHHDYHRWDRHENGAYRRYLNERHEQYRDYDKLDKDEQRNYWNWRHDHPGSDHD